MISASNQMQKYILAFLLYMNNQSDLRSAVSYSFICYLFGWIIFCVLAVALLGQ